MNASAPFIAPDGSYLIFSAKPPGPGVDWDLFMSKRLAGGGWSPPQKLSGKVNTGDMEISPSVSPDGKYLFFGRAARPAGGTLAQERIEIMVIEATAEGL